ncbi:hypothetical protein ACQRBH_16325 [Bariatricus sp. SGI.161]|uniref:hypothetical protein n=1 Tax=Bariatricus sp. SGI.161 TaxID=3420550 RepID=UPI003CFD486F
MGFLDFLGDTMTDSINSANKRINSAFREELRRKNDKEFERIYRNRYNNEKLVMDNEKMDILEKEAQRRGIY